MKKSSKKKRIKPSDLIVGRFRLGHRWVQLYVMPDSNGGTGEFAPQDPQICTIKIGVSDPWNDTVGTLLHEAAEVVMHDLRHAYKHAGSVDFGTGTFIFHMDHVQYSEVMQRVGHFIAAALPRFSAYYKRFHKNT